MPKKIIGLVRYDTATATRLHTADDGQAPPKWRQVLFRGVNGGHFLVTRGDGAAQLTADEDAGGPTFQPLTVAQATEWGQVNMGAAKFATTFGAIITEA